MPLQTPGGIGDQSSGHFPEESPLKTELSHSVGLCQKRSSKTPGSREPDSTRPPAGVKKATARREKAEEALKQAQEALEQARLQETRAIQELEDAKAAAAPPPPPDTPPPGSVSLSSDDVAGLTSFFQELAEEREAAPGAEPPSKKGRVGPYGETPNLKAAKRRGSARKIGKGAGLFGIHAESEFEIWGWVLPGSHPRNSLPERLWQRQWLRSRSRCCRTSKDPPAPTADPQRKRRRKQLTQPTQDDEDSNMQDAQAR